MLTADARVRIGLCRSCGRLRGGDGTATQCRECADARSRVQAGRNERLRLERRMARLCLDCGESREDSGNELCPVCQVKLEQRGRRHRERQKGRAA